MAQKESNASSNGTYNSNKYLEQQHSMKRRSIIVFLLFVFIFAMASNNQGPFKRKKKTTADTLVLKDSTLTDTLQMDSLTKAIYKRNLQVDDSLRIDSINRAKSNGIEDPIQYEGRDSLVYDALNRTAYMYGAANVNYQNMTLKSEKIQLDLNKNVVHATGVADSTEEKGLKGIPQFKMGQEEYETDTIAFNIKSKRGLIRNVYTAQQEGFLTSQLSKRNADGTIYLQHGRYTTCDEEHPDFYIALSRAKVRPNKDVVFGPAYLVVADVPLPLAIPYGFFPFSKKYSSGLIMPSYGEEKDRGFYLRDGGYYFALSDKWDLKLMGEIFTRGSWGLSAASNYRKRYGYNGQFFVSYQHTRLGDKGLPDFSKEESFKVQWSHTQDAKANPFRTFTASVNFATSSYEQNNLNSMYNPQTKTQSTRTSSVSWGTSFSSIGLSLTSTANITQNMRDSSMTVTLPDVNISLSRLYPFRRKHAIGKERWYEKISLSYTGQISNSITTKEDHLLHSDLSKEWRNGWRHYIPISGSFNLFNYITVTPSFNFTDRMYANKVVRSWDEVNQKEVSDTINGFHNIYDWNFTVSANTKLYGFYRPSKWLFGDKIEKVRHVVTPQITYSYAPDFSSDRYGYYDSYQRTNSDGTVELVSYSPWQNSLFGVPAAGRTGSITFKVDNNIEMKVKSEKDTTGVRKVSIIDNLGFDMSYNMAAREKKWSNLGMNIRLKWWKNYTFNMRAVFASYAYELNEQGRPYVGNHTLWGMGKFGRFQGFSQNISFTLNPEKLKKWFGKSDEEDEDELDDDAINTNVESNIDDDLANGQHRAKKRKNSGKAETDEDGYMLFNMPWSLTFGYGITMRENTTLSKFNYNKMRYPYKFTQNLNVSGNLRLSDGWNINFSTGWDFENHDMSMTTATIQRDLHCFNMSCSVVLAPYTSYNFTFRANASTLTDALKYDKHNNSISNAVEWY